MFASLSSLNRKNILSDGIKKVIKTALRKKDPSLVFSNDEALLKFLVKDGGFPKNIIMQSFYVDEKTELYKYPTKISPISIKTSVDESYVLSYSPRENPKCRYKEEPFIIKNKNCSTSCFAQVDCDGGITAYVSCNANVVTTSGSISCPSANDCAKDSDTSVDFVSAGAAIPERTTPIPEKQTVVQ